MTDDKNLPKTAQNIPARQSPDTANSSSSASVNDLPEEPKPQLDLKTHAELPDAPQARESTLAKVYEELKKHNLHPSAFALNYEPAGTKELVKQTRDEGVAVPQAAFTSSTVNLPQIPLDSGPFDLKSTQITPKLGGSIDFPLSPENHRRGINEFAGLTVDAQEVISHGHDISSVVRERVTAGIAHYNHPETVPAFNDITGKPPAKPTIHGVSRTGLDAGITVSTDTKFPIPQAIAEHLPSKTFGKDNLVTLGIPANQHPHIDVTSQARLDTIETGATMGVSVPLATALDGGATVKAGYNPISTTMFSKAGWQAPHGFNAGVDITDVHKVKHGLSGLFHKMGQMFHHNKDREIG